MVRDGLDRTGYDEVTLTSLSSADFSGIGDVVSSIINDPECSGQVSVSLPSLRVDAFTVGLAAEIQKVRRTGLTFAPEGGTWRMRQVINKLIREEDLYAAVDAAFSQGWRRVKLYFLIGLPTETDEDVLGHHPPGRRLCGHRSALSPQRHRHRLGGWLRAQGAHAVPVVRPEHHGGAAAQGGPAQRRRPRTRGLTLRWHDPEATAVEGLVSRGDRRMGAVIEHVWRARGHVPGMVRALRPRVVDRLRSRPPGSTSTRPSTATATNTRSWPGTTSRPGCTATSCGRTSKKPWPSTVSRTAAGPRATTAAPAPGSGWSTWWPRRCRPRAGARARARTWPPVASVPVPVPGHRRASARSGPTRERTP